MVIREVNLPPESEAEFLRCVIQLAQMRGWRVAHFRPARTAHGWRTAVQGDGKGFPDLVMVRGSRIVFAELKSDRGKPSEEQTQWLLDLRKAGLHAHIWRPRDWEAIKEWLE